MSSPFSIPPATLFRLAAISPVALQPLSAATPGSAAALLDGGSSIVELSGLGQVLATGSALASRLEALRANTATATPGSVLSGAQNFVAAFNGLEQGIANVQPFLATLPDHALVARFAQALGTAANDSGLQAVGISLRPGSLTDPAASVARLAIDQNALSAAAEAHPQEVAALLVQATQPLLRQVTAFEVQATGTNGLPGDGSVLAAGVPTTLLQNLPADTVLNNVQLSDLDLAAAGVDANTIESTGAALATSLSATLSGPLAGAAPATATAAIATAPVTPAAAASAAATAAAAILGPESAVVSAPATAVTDENPAATPAAANGEPLAADPNADAARLALRQLLADAALRDFIFDPAYSALIASSHLIDFISPTPLTRASAIPADIPGAVLPVNRARAISSYAEAANGFVR